MFVKGNIIAGEFDSTINEFSLQKVKNFETESVLNEDQLNNIYHYLKKHQHEEDGQIITLYDQMLVRLAQNEVNQLIVDLEKVMSLYH
ncbi:MULTISPECIES: hypothetical protein [Bacillaceae]|jgi:hypothetical protein|uniref:Uncharacterized protein n=1 Tax=Priestia flexa TaxID=86664 RepID=A0A1N7BRL7_9BACI|nr:MULTISPECIES: hypothetical protein [Bacillaceae]AQX56303.1 hypothetical protein BC359_19750 [Priestia flexa]MBN8253963.1 hypothetical protein [Priestia flexa]MBN8436405.1 hypothetical protein [Priestia flexa]MBY6088629.1 hypothetical protein [Priestia flexa]MCA0968892.1 hypothetical protein [Priestia flexa]